ncbi:MAG: DUF669 domain-containing protein [Deltaproteobacteria bacterium]|nr:DUF669 domain-containing protein [Deltaproteobacteria bacterium]
MPGEDEAGVDLAKFDSDFAEAPVEEKDFDSVPDGKFQANVEKVEITTAKSSGNPMLKWTLRILAPKFAGRLLWRNNVMATRENIRWLKNDLHTCGLDLQKLSDLPANLERLLDVKLEITKRTKGDNENVYFNRRIVMDGPAAQGGGDGAGASKSDVPF